VSLDLYIDGTIREIAQYSLNIAATAGQRGSFNMRVISTSGAYRPEQGHEIALWDGGTKLWAGSVDEVSEVSITEAGAAAGAFYDIRGITWEQRLDRRRCYNPITSLPAHYDGTFLFAANPATDTLTTVSAHGLSNGAKVRVKAHAQGVLCDGLSATIEYFVISASGSNLQLSLTSGGSAVNIVDAGTLDQVLLTTRAGNVVVDLVTNYASNEGIGTTNVDAGAVLDVLTFDANISVSEAIAQLAEVCGFAWWMDEERELYFKPRTFSTAPFNISSTSANYRSLKIRRTREDKVNAILTRVPWNQIVSETESFTGDGSTRTFTLAHRLAEIVSISVDGQVAEIGQFLADSDREWYWEYGSTKIRQNSANDVLTSDNTLQVIYQKLGADVVTAEDATDITATITQEGGGSGRYERYSEREIGQVQAFLAAQAVIAARKDPVVEVEYETDQIVEPLCATVKPGQLQTVANTPRGVISATYLVNEVYLTDVAGQYLKARVRAISGSSIIGIQEYWKAMIGGGLSTVSTGGTLTAAAPASTSIGIHLVAGATSITLDLANGLVQEIVLDRATTTITDVVFGSDAVTPGTRFMLIFTSDGTAGRNVAWGTKFAGTGAISLDGEANAINIFEFMTMRNGDFLRCVTPAVGVD
jgi:hypothetical protein